MDKTTSDNYGSIVLIHSNFAQQTSMKALTSRRLSDHGISRTVASGVHESQRIIRCGLYKLLQKPEGQ